MVEENFENLPEQDYSRSKSRASGGRTITAWDKLHQKLRERQEWEKKIS